MYDLGIGIHKNELISFSIIFVSRMIIISEYRYGEQWTGRHEQEPSLMSNEYSHSVVVAFGIIGTVSGWKRAYSIQPYCFIFQAYQCTPLIFTS